MNEPNIQHQRLPTEHEVDEEARSGRTFFGRLFKIARCERRHFIYTSSIFFIVSFIYSIGQPVKDAIVQDNLDSSSLSPLKMWVVMPIVLFSVFVVNRCLVTMSASQIFSKSMIIFASLFLLYGLVLKPFRKYLEMDQFRTRDWYIDSSMEFRGLEGLGGFTLVINSWVSASIYLVFELWASLIFQYILYCVLNDIYTRKQWLRIVPLQLVFANLALILAAGITYLLSNAIEASSYEMGEFIRTSIQVFLGSLCLVIFFLHRHFVIHVQPIKMLIPEEGRRRAASKTSPGFIEGIKVVATSKLVIAMSTVVMVYNISVALCDFTFKICMKKYAVESNILVDTHVYRVVSTQQFLIAFIAIFLLLSPFSNLIRKKGFTAVAMVPIFVSSMGMSLLFGISAYNTGALARVPILGRLIGYPENPNIKLEQIIGLLVTGAFKIMKYTALDISKEALSMKISDVYRARFKGVYDGLCGKLGKASGAGVSQMESLLMNVKDIRDVAHVTFVVVGSLSVAWFFAVRYLGKNYDKAVASNTDIDIGLISKKHRNK